MSKVLSDTAAIAAKPVLETCNPDYSGFRNSSPMIRIPRDTCAGNESLHHAKQVLEAKKPGSGK